MSLLVESPTAIVNRALGLIEHARLIDNIESSDKEATAARLRYDVRRRAVLEKLDWGFARGRAKAGQVLNIEAPENLPIALGRPAGALRIRAVRAGGTNLPYSVEGQYIFSTAAQGVQIVFTRNESNATLFPPAFTAALEYLLAAEFAMLYARSKNRSEQMMAFFAEAIREADVLEAAEWDETDAFAGGPWVGAVERPWSAGY